MKQNAGCLLGVGFFLLIFFPVLTNNCSNKQNKQGYTKEGLDIVVKDLYAIDNYTVILYDMDYVDRKYKHQYQILIPRADSTMDESMSEWYNVSEPFFNKHVDNLGMELAHKKDGHLEKEVAPAGYSEYVGNPRYGHWEQRDGGSFWAFYGKFAFMSSMFNMMSRPAYYGHYNDYNRNYRGGRGVYRGPDGYYGTRGYSSTNSGRKSSWASKPQTFKSKVRSQVNRSSSSSTKKTTTRSTNRYSSSSSSRSRSGGYGGK